MNNTVQLIIEMDKAARQRIADAKAEKKLIETETEDKLKALSKKEAARSEAEISRICAEIKSASDEEISKIKSEANEKCRLLDEIMDKDADEKCSDIIERIFRGAL